MAITLAPGQGILGGVTLDEEKLDRELAEAREKDRDYAEREAAFKAKCERIEAWLGSLLWAQLEVEGSTAPITETTKADMGRFQESCARYGYQHLPAAPAVVAEYLIVESETAAQAERMLDSISTIHRAMRLQDPESDPLPRAALRWFRDCEDQEEEKKLAPKRQAKAKKLNGSASNKEQK